MVVAIGFEGASQSRELISNPVRRAKVSERDLPRRINCKASNAGTGFNSLWGRRADRQCSSRDSEIVVVGGVTPTQGDGSAVHRAKDLRFDSFRNFGNGQQ